MTSKDLRAEFKKETGDYPSKNTPNSIIELRYCTLEELRKYTFWLEERYIALSNQKGILRPAGSLTCDFCSDKDTCEYAGDKYNTDGDCLAIK